MMYRNLIALNEIAVSVSQLQWNDSRSRQFGVENPQLRNNRTEAVFNRPPF